MAEPKAPSAKPPPLAATPTKPKNDLADPSSTPTGSAPCLPSWNRLTSRSRRTSHHRPPLYLSRLTRWPRPPLRTAPRLSRRHRNETNQRQQEKTVSATKDSMGGARRSNRKLGTTTPAGYTAKTEIGRASCRER